MPSNNSRQTAKRVVPTELNSSHSLITTSDEDRAPNFLVLPSGAGANRVMLAGVAMDVQDVSGEDSDNEYIRLECTDVTGTSFFSYAGQYQPEAKAQMKALDAPSYVSVIGKPRTFENDDGQVRVSIRPESVKVIDEDEYFGLLREAADHTIGRLTGERGADNFQGMAQNMHTDDEREAIYDAAVETLEEVQGIVADGDDTLSRDELEAMEYAELRSLASEFDGISGNAGADTLVLELEGQPVPA